MKAKMSQSSTGLIDINSIIIYIISVGIQRDRTHCKTIWPRNIGLWEFFLD